MNFNLANVLNYWINNYQDILYNIGYTISLLIILPTIISLIIGLPLSIIIAKNQKLKVIIQIVNFLGSIPSLVMFLIMVTIGLGIGLKPSLITLIMYSLVPIVTYTVPTLQSIDSNKAKALNMTKLQSIVYIDIPMSSPQLINGIKMSLIYGVSNSILCANIGCNGIGKYVLLGLSQMRFDLAMTGLVPTFIIIIIIEYFGTKISTNLANKIKNEI